VEKPIGWPLASINRGACDRFPICCDSDRMTKDAYGPKIRAKEGNPIIARFAFAARSHRPHGGGEGKPRCPSFFSYEDWATDTAPEKDTAVVGAIAVPIGTVVALAAHEARIVQHGGEAFVAFKCGIFPRCRPSEIGRSSALHYRL